MARELDRADLERMVDALERVHHGQAPGGAEEGLRALAQAASGPEALYETAKRAFGAHERTLRAQAEAAQRLVDGLRQRGTTPRQALLRLVVGPDGWAGGRFVVHNEAAQSETLRPVARFHLPVSFRPDEVVLPPGRRVGIDVRVHVGDTFAPGETATLLVDVLAGDRPRLKLWLDLVIEPR